MCQRAKLVKKLTSFLISNIRRNGVKFVLILISRTFESRNARAQKKMGLHRQLQGTITALMKIKNIMSKNDYSS